MKFPIVLSTPFEEKDIQVEFLPAEERRYKTAAKQAIRVLTERCASGYYEALRDEMLAWERECGRALRRVK